MFAKALGAEVYVLSHSPNKEQDAKKLGADHFIITSNKVCTSLHESFDQSLTKFQDQMGKIQHSLDLIVSTVDVSEGYPLKDFLS
jgi:alcohol dehydrogenase (NADP+)